MKVSIKVSCEYVIENIDKDSLSILLGILKSNQPLQYKSVVYVAQDNLRLMTLNPDNVVGVLPMVTWEDVSDA